MCRKNNDHNHSGWWVNLFFCQKLSICLRVPLTLDKVAFPVSLRHKSWQINPIRIQKKKMEIKENTLMSFMLRLPIFNKSQRSGSGQSDKEIQVKWNSWRWTHTSVANAPPLNNNFKLHFYRFILSMTNILSLKYMVCSKMTFQSIAVARQLWYKSRSASVP